MAGLDNYLHLAFVRTHPGLLRFWSDMETSLLGKKVRRDIKSPIVVCGLARSGTTLLTHILHLHPRAGSFVYRDLPFVEIPYLWHFVSGLYYGHPSAKAREHGDALSIDPDSPDAFEELLWKDFVPDHEGGDFCRVLDETYEHPDLEQKLPEAINKMLITRGNKERSLAKGNYNLYRLRYILKLFPDARIILCVRDPFSHAQSLARVHAKFLKMSQDDKYFAKRLQILGHYEFGPLRQALTLPGGRSDRTLAHWQKGEDYLGYLLQWGDAYSFAKNAYGTHPNILWLDAASMLRDKEGTVSKVLRFCDLPEEELDMAKALSLVKDTTSYAPPPTPYDAEMQDLYASLLTLCA